MAMEMINPGQKKQTNLLSVLAPVAGVILGGALTIATGGLGAPIGAEVAGAGAAAGASAGAAAGTGAAAAGLGAGAAAGGAAGAGIGEVGNAVGGAASQKLAGDLAAAGTLGQTALSGYGTGSTVGNIVSPFKQAQATPAMQRRNEASQGLSSVANSQGSSQYLKQSLDALKTQSPEVQKAYEPPLTQAYLMAHLDEYRQRKNGGGGMA